MNWIVHLNKGSYSDFIPVNLFLTISAQLNLHATQAALDLHNNHTDKSGD